MKVPHRASLLEPDVGRESSPAPHRRWRLILRLSTSQGIGWPSDRGIAGLLVDGDSGVGIGGEIDASVEAWVDRRFSSSTGRMPTVNA